MRQPDTLDAFRTLAAEAARLAKEHHSRLSMTIDGREWTFYEGVGPFRFDRRAELRKIGERCARRLESMVSDVSAPFGVRAELLDGIAMTDSVRLGRVAIRATQHDPSPEMRWYGLQTAYLIGAPAWFRTPFLAGLRDSSGLVRRAAASYLGGFVRSRHAVAVRSALLAVASGEDDDDVRSAALRSVSHYRGRCVDDLLAALASGPAGPVQTTASELLSDRNGSRRGGGPSPHDDLSMRERAKQAWSQEQERRRGRHRDSSKSTR